jgi:hypothetical protein
MRGAVSPAPDEHYLVSCRRKCGKNSRSTLNPNDAASIVVPRMAASPAVALLSGYHALEINRAVVTYEARESWHLTTARRTRNHRRHSGVFHARPNPSVCGQEIARIFTIDGSKSESNGIGNRALRESRPKPFAISLCPFVPLGRIIIRLTNAGSDRGLDYAVETKHRAAIDPSSLRKC